MKCDVFEACSDPPFSLVSRRWSQWTSCCSVWTQSKTESCGFGRIRRERSGPWTSRSDPSARRPSSHANTHPRARRPRTDSTLLCSRWDLFCTRLELPPHCDDSAGAVHCDLCCEWRCQGCAAGFASLLSRLDSRLRWRRKRGIVGRGGAAEADDQGGAF